MDIIRPVWSWKTKLSTRPYTKYVVLHHAAAKTCTAQQIDNWHKGNGWSGIGYHFFVRKDGSIYEGRPLWAVGAHASGKNNESIGVCAEGDYSVEKEMPKAQKEAIKQILEYIKFCFPSASYAVGHGEVGATGCPGDYYPLAEMKEFYKNIKKEGLTMTQYEELKKQMQELAENVSRLSNRISDVENPMIYNYIDENTEKIAPDANDALHAAVDRGILQGDENGLNLTYEMVRQHIWNYRAGLYN